MITIQGLKLLDYHLTVDATTTRCDYHSIFAGTLVIIIQYLHFWIIIQQLTQVQLVVIIIQYLRVP